MLKHEKHILALDGKEKCITLEFSKSEIAKTLKSCCRERRNS
jgi:hypothetical protein